MMKKRISVLVLGAALIGVFAYWHILSKQRQLDYTPDYRDSPAGDYRIVEPDYSRLVQVAQAGDCDAAYRLGLHHINFSLNTEEAIRWLRLAAKCPNVAAKEELLSILAHMGTDAEVDRLVLEIEALDPKATVRRSVEWIRAQRDERPLEKKTEH